MDIALAAVTAGAALAIAVLTYALVRLFRSSSRTAEERLAAAVGELNARMETIVRELGDALERAEVETRRISRLGELATTIDLDEVLARTLEAAREVARADAAVVTLAEGRDGRPLVATLGLSRDEAERQPPITGPPDGRPARAVGISYNGAAAQGGDRDLIHAGIAVPLLAEGSPVGNLAVFTRSDSVTFGDEAVEQLEEIATRAGPALDNARRFQEARKLADLDALTGLHNRRFFHDTLAREVARAQRYGRDLALAVFDVDDFKAVNDRIGHLDGDSVLAEAARRIRDAVRSADIPCRVGGDEFGVILPESSRTDAERLSRRIQLALGAEPVAEAGTLSLSAGIAALNGRDDGRSLFQRADSALYRAKESGKGRVVTADAPRDAHG
jgi:diguanylate cyclase (GGDEF)-like protein